MWIPKWYWEAQIRQRDELERRVNRLELILLQDAKNKIASLKDEEAGTNKKACMIFASWKGIISIQEIL